MLCHLHLLHRLRSSLCVLPLSSLRSSHTFLSDFTLAVSFDARTPNFTPRQFLIPLFLKFSIPTFLKLDIAVGWRCFFACDDELASWITIRINQGFSLRNLLLTGRASGSFG